MNAEVNGIRFSDEDVVNPEDFIAAGEYNPHKVHGYLLHDHGFSVAVVFAHCLQDALDIAADSGKLDRYRVSETELKDYGEEGEGLSYLGNAGEPFDMDTLGVIELHNPKFSFCALYNNRE